MPGYHRLSLIPEIQEEFQELIDGVIPRYYPETYGYLMELRCVKLLEDNIYQNTTNNYKICSSCYINTSDERKAEYAIIATHNLVHKNSVENHQNCTSCDKLIVRIKPADECRACIEEYLHTDKEYLDQGWGAPVVAR